MSKRREARRARQFAVEQKRWQGHINREVNGAKFQFLEDGKAQGRQEVMRSLVKMEVARDSRPYLLGQRPEQPYIKIALAPDFAFPSDKLSFQEYMHLSRVPIEPLLFEAVQKGWADDSGVRVVWYDWQPVRGSKGWLVQPSDMARWAART